MTAALGLVVFEENGKSGRFWQVALETQVWFPETLKSHNNLKWWSVPDFVGDSCC